MKEIFVLPLFLFSLSLLSQNVGIGTASPTEKLQVEGNIAADTLKINGFQFPPEAGEGKILTSDANGNARWVDQSMPQNNAIQEYSDGNEGFGLWGECTTYPNITGYHPVSESNGSAQAGYNVSVSGNFAIVGAPNDKIEDVIRGSATVYFYNGSAWVMMQKLTDPEGEVGDYFGFSVEISANYAMVGAIYDDVGGVVNQGSVCCYSFDGTTWGYVGKLSDIDGQANDYFGTDISLYGDNAVIGAYADNESYSNQGSVSMYQNNGSEWIFAQKLLDPQGSGNDYFGSAVAMNGNFIMVGCTGDDVLVNNVNYIDQGSVCVFQYNGSTWDFFSRILGTLEANSSFGNSIAIDANYVVIGAFASGANNDGQASIYYYNGTAWVLNTRLSQPPSDPEENFGTGVAIAGPYVLIGTPQDGTYYGRIGSASLYFRVGSKWTRLQFILDPYGQVNDGFGVSVAINNVGRFLIGVPGFNNNMGKAVFGKSK